MTNEAFSYDQLQRLSSTTRNFVPEAMTYYNTGNIKTKYNIAAQYEYDTFAPSACQNVVGSAAPGAFALTRIGSSESFCYDSRGNQIAGFAGGNLKRKISYSSFDAAQSIVSNFPRAHVTRFHTALGVSACAVTILMARMCSKTA